MKLQVHKDIEEILEAELLPNGWYTVQIMEEPKIGPNWTMQNEPAKTEMCRNELVLKTEIVSEVEDWNGRPLTIKLAIPNAQDATGKNKMGQTWEDQYLGWLSNFCKAFNNLSKMSGDELEFRPNTMAEVEVITIQTKAGQRFNSVQPWSKPRPVGISVDDTPKQNTFIDAAGDNIAF